MMTQQTDLSSHTPDAGSLPKWVVPLWLVVLLVFGFWIRVPSDASYDYDMDEAMHMNIASGDSIAEVWKLSQNEVHPPLFYILLHFWILFFHGPALVRGLPLLLGLALIPIYYFIGKRISGVWGGLCGATLVTLSIGCVLQSFVLRQYCAMIFFLSLGFYCYVSWRDDRKRSTLYWYILWGSLASLSHFTTIFTIFCITLSEATLIFFERNASWQVRRQWLGANLAVAAVWSLIYYLWQPTFKAYSVCLSGAFTYAGTFRQILSDAFNAPFSAGDYIYPPIPHLPAIVFCVFLCGFLYSRRQLYPYLTLMAIGCVMSIALYGSGLYMTLGTRHNLWLLPLILPLTGAVAASLLHSRQIALLLASLTMFSAIHDYNQRFHDHSEIGAGSRPYEQTEEMEKQLEALGPRDLIETTIDEAVRWTNIYKSIDDRTFPDMKMAAIAPYRHTHILFNPYYHADYSLEIFLSTLKAAQAQHMLDNIDRIAFLQDRWRLRFVYDLMFCSDLKKEVILIPPFTEPPLHQEDIGDRLSLLLISKDALVKDVLPPNGKARHCFFGEHK